MSPESIAQAHRISVSSVYQYLMDKENKTQHDQRGGSESKLNAEQTQELLSHIQTNTYLKYICKYSEIWDQVFNPWNDCLAKRTQLCLQTAYQSSRQTRSSKAFIEYYEKQNLPDDHEIYFLDAVHPEFQSVYGWIKKGEVKTLPTTSKQYRLHFIGVISLENMQLIAQEYKTVNAESMIEFLKHLEASSSATKIHIISDNGRANKNKAIQAYLPTSRIEMHYLPPYSPNLNPIERLWMRERNTYNKCYDKFENFSKAIRKFFFEDIPKMRDVLEKRINDKFQRINLNPITIAAT